MQAIFTVREFWDRWLAILEIDTINVGLSFLLKITKYRLHNMDDSSIGVALITSETI
jgi:hypothetical protein